MISELIRWPIRVQAPHERRAHILQTSGAVRCGASLAGPLIEASREVPTCSACRRLPQFLSKPERRANEHG